MGKQTKHRAGKSTQGVLSFGHGGWRPGAGRKRAANRRRRAPHRARPVLSRHHPVHIVLRVCREVRNLRAKKRYQAVRRAFVQGCNREDFRVIDWSLQGDHIHLIVEANEQSSLSRGMQGLNVRLARALNRVAGRRGPVFAERYYAHVLRAPREVRNARAYVMNNARRHTRECSEDAGAKWVDPCSSWAWFDGWRDLPKNWLRKARAGPEAVAPVAEAETWLLRVGWRRHGLVRLDETPGGSRRRRSSP